MGENVRRAAVGIVLIVAVSCAADDPLLSPPPTTWTWPPYPEVEATAAVVDGDPSLRWRRPDCSPNSSGISMSIDGFAGAATIEQLVGLAEHTLALDRTGDGVWRRFESIVSHDDGRGGIDAMLRVSESSRGVSLNGSSICSRSQAEVLDELDLLIGRPIDAFEAAAAQDGYVVLIVEAAGEPLDRPNDSKPYRINVGATDGVLDRIVDVG